MEEPENWYPACMAATKESFFDTINRMVDDERCDYERCDDGRWTMNDNVAIFQNLEQMYRFELLQQKNVSDPLKGYTF